MNKRIGTMLCLASILLTQTINIVSAVDNSPTVPKSRTHKISESYNSRNTFTIDLGDRARSISSVTTNNGTASYSFDEKTKRITVTVQDGQSVSKWDPYYYSKTGYYNYTSSSSSHDSYKNYSDNSGYSGTIYYDRTVSNQKSKRVSGTVKNHKRWRRECTNPGSLVANSNYDPDKFVVSNGSTWKYFYTGGNWVGGTLEADVLTQMSSNFRGSSLSSISYNDGSYSTNNISVSQGSVTTDYIPVYVPHPDNGYSLPTLGQRQPEKDQWTTYNLSGTAYGPMEYTHYYDGTVYKGAYRNTYSYNITINYEAEPLPPNKSNINSPLSDTLVVRQEGASFNWDYSDPEDLPLSKSELIFKNVDTKEIYTIKVPGQTRKHHISLPPFPEGHYSVTVKVYNSKNKFSESNPISFRYCRYKKKGFVVTKEIISQGKPLTFLNVSTKSHLETNMLQKTKIDGYVLLPDESGNYNYSPASSTSIPISLKGDESGILRLDTPVSKFKVYLNLITDENELSSITPILNNISVSAK